jgi:hypothetical protein
MGQRNDGQNENGENSPLSLDRWLENNHVSEPDSVRVETVKSIEEPPVIKKSTSRGLALLLVCCAIAFFSIGYFSATVQPSSCPRIYTSSGSSRVNQIE